MRNSNRTLFLAAATILVALPAAAASCDSLKSVKIDHVTIDSAELIKAGEYKAPPGGRGGPPDLSDLPQFCRITATSRPTADSDIKIEVWLPTNTWNGKFKADGNGGWTGSISASTLADGVRRGYAQAMTDTGHEGGSASFAMNHPEKLIDFGYRSIYEMAVTGQMLTEEFYESPIRYSYFNGCSAGGRQALQAANMYPELFDGVVAGSPGAYWTGRALQSVWIGQASHASETSMIPSEKFPAIHAAVLKACDTIDGAEDGIIDDPRNCHFDPGMLECEGADMNDCLTPAQIATARKIYADVTNPRTGTVYFPGDEPGSELGWRTMAGANPFGPGLDLFRYLVYNDPDWDYKTFDFDKGAEAALDADRPADVFRADLSDFYKKGGKVVQYHGWADPQIAPRSSVMFYDTQVRHSDLATVRDSHRLFMVPGMAHCGGGEGTSQFDMIHALEQWVEDGQAPDSVPATRESDGRTRPLCAYPEVAKYKGTGSVDQAENFSCQAP